MKDIKDMSIEELQAELDAGAQKQVQEPVSTVETIARGFSQGYTYNMADEAEAAVKSTYNGSKYEDELEHARERDAQTRAESPWLYGGSAFAGAVVSPISKIGAGVGFVRNVAVSAAQGATAMFGASDDKFSVDGLRNVLYGTAGGAAGGAIVQGVFTGGKSLVNSFRNRFFLGGTKSLNKAGREILKKTGQDMNQYVKRIDNIQVQVPDAEGNLISQPLVKMGNGLDDVAEKIGIALETKNKDKLNILYALDDSIDFNKTDAERFYKGMVDKLENLKAGTDDAELIKEYVKVQTRLRDSFTEALVDDAGKPIYKVIEDGAGGHINIAQTTIKENLTKPSRVYKLMQDWNSEAFNNKSLSNTYSNALKSITNYMDDGLDNIINSSKNLPKDAAKGFHEIRKDISSLLHFNDVVTNSINSSEHSGMGLARDIMVSSMGALSAGVTGGYGTTVAVIYGLKAVSKIPEVDVGTSRLLTTLATHMDSMGSGATTIARRIQAASEVSASEFTKVTQAEYAKASLSQTKLPRDNAGVLNRQDEILFFLNDINPKLAKQFKQAIDDGNSTFIENTMNQISKLPGADKYIEQGLGWNKKLISDDDKAEYLNRLNKMDVSAKQKVELKQNIMQPGAVPIPMVKQEENPFEMFIRQQQEKSQLKKPRY